MVDADADGCKAWVGDGGWWRHGWGMEEAWVEDEEASTHALTGSPGENSGAHPSGAAPRYLARGANFRQACYPVRGGNIRMAHQHKYLSAGILFTIFHLRFHNFRQQSVIMSHD